MTIPKQTAQGVRAAVLGLLYPSWNYFSSTGENPEISRLKIRVEKLRLENALLHSELDRFQDLYQHEHFLSQKLDELIVLKDSESKQHPLLRQHYNELSSLLSSHIEAYPAKVVYRDHSFWNSSLWLNIGEKENEKQGRLVIGKNSPVVIGTSVIGVVDYLGEEQCRVRLITDRGLTPSVRATRGYGQNRLLYQHVIALVDALMLRSDLEGYQVALLTPLEALQKELQIEQEEFYLAKGELQGALNPAWGKAGKTLRGVGFNYDYADERGPARDLRSGVPQRGYEHLPTLPLLKENDLLVTTGMDGVFPEGLQVATVTKVFQLQEGSFSYELEASPVFTSFDDLSVVFVLPPQAQYPFKET